MISFNRQATIKVEDALKYIDSIPWEGSEFDDRSEIEFLMQILTKDRYEDFDEDFKDLAEWLHKPRHDKMKKARQELLEEMMQNEAPVTQEEIDSVASELEIP